MILQDPIAKKKKMSLDYHTKMEKNHGSNASDRKVYVYDLEKAQQTVLETNFTPERCQWARGEGLIFTLRQWKQSGSILDNGFRKHGIFCIKRIQKIIHPSLGI